MKTVVKTGAIAAVLGVLLIGAVPVQANSAGDPPSLLKHSCGKGDRMLEHLDRLEAAGYDVSAIRTAVESGDTETARTLMRAFMEEQKNASPNPPAGGRPVRGGMREIPTGRV